MRIICSECSHCELTSGHEDTCIEFLTPTGSSGVCIWLTNAALHTLCEDWSPPFHCLAWYNHCTCQRKQRNVRKHLYLSGSRVFPSYLSQTLEQDSTEASVLTLAAVKKWSPSPCSQKMIYSPLSLYTDNLCLWQQCPSRKMLIKSHSSTWV